MNFIKDKIRVTCEELKKHSFWELEELQGIECVPNCGYKTDNVPPLEGWEPWNPMMRINGADSHYWFRAKFTTPKNPGLQYVLKIVTGMEDKWDATAPQSIIYLNGKMVQAFDTNHREVYLEPGTEYELYNYFYIGMLEDDVAMKLKLCAINPMIEKLYYDMKVPYDCALLLKEDSGEYIAIMSALEQTANLLDMRSIYSEAYVKSVQEALDFIEKEFYEKVCSTEGKPVITCIGHTHIDVEWKWDRAQTREKIQRSFSNAAALMERYPEYPFTLSQPELYRYLKEEAPEKYEELKKLVAEGRWEPEGSMYVEADCNLISGESFVRQIMQGKKYFKEEFGKENHILLLPDVFGYSAAMPQILKKCGIDHFVTSKISWNETNTMPYDTFLWQGIDGTEIFTNFISTQDYTEPASRFTTYNGMLTPTEIKGTWNRFRQKEYTNYNFTFFGYGDGGGGPTKEMLENQRRLAKGIPGMPVTKMGFLYPHLKKVQEEFDASCVRTRRTPRWVGELYLEFHRGTYTSIAKNKRGNRKAELLLQKAEGISYLDKMFGGSYDAEGIYSIWNKVLHNQFHDIIPGSSILSVYEGTDVDYKEIQEYGQGVVSEKMNSLSRQVSTNGGIFVYNPLGFARKGTILVDGATRETEEIPAFGWKVVNLPEVSCGVTVEGCVAENSYYKMELDKAGRIASLWDKQAGREVFLPGQFGNEIQVFEDYPREYDNWELTNYYKEKKWILDDEAKISAVQDGDRAGFRVERKYLDSTMCQNIWLYGDSRRIDFDHDIDWHEHHQVVKAAFPVDVHATSATYEIQFGHVNRPTHGNTSWDQAKFEVCGHKWADISDHGYGVSLLNDCKYGHNAEGSTLKLTLLKCGTDPNPEADQGQHIFTYSLLPHRGDFRDAGVIQEAYNLNQPLEAVKVSVQNGTLPEEYSLISCDKPGIIIETAKKAEASDALVVRLYEAYDQREKVKLSVAEGFTRAYLCDMLENMEKELDFDGKTLELPISNFEIITLMFTK